ncbi:dTDP-4-dehydrorhamnose 3,5-epimerase [Paucihalobacter ruber]|uniref:dTDP-4-dehydrorhamnose 3,5-epimerase n=1 Tax=Paucihalobacter ruber TaxID=2567861 RepID=A0A506PN05_9FLAO|nr:dTDP-4-dehydrorhamnose 3,5-epimerase [Paucihalobacter ruber]TPV34949.1 dTDP-4-dehydrorhamnose 3,5-epimerase [Paucihalobacter ruber]
MTVENSNLKDCFIIHPRVFEDDRGYFYESYNKQGFKKKTGLDIDFVQDNQSQSSKGVLRGLHFQVGDYEQAKLVRVIKGSVLDVCVDLRENSETYLKHFTLILSEENKKQLFIPRGFAHGFLVLEDNTIFSYKCDNYYHKESERGIIYNDPDLAIDWRFENSQLLISDKDKVLPSLQKYQKQR